MDNKKMIFQVEGNTNDLLQVSSEHNMKRTSLVYLIPFQKKLVKKLSQFQLIQLTKL